MKELTKFININENLLAFIIFSQQNNKKLIIGELIKSFSKTSKRNFKQIFVTEIDLVEYKSFLYHLWSIQKQNREQNIKLNFDEYKEMVQELKDNFSYENLVYSNLDSNIENKDFFVEIENFIKRTHKKSQLEALEISSVILNDSKDYINYRYILFEDNNSIKKLRKCDQCSEDYFNLKQGQYWDYFQCRNCKNIKKLNDFFKIIKGRI